MKKEYISPKTSVHTLSLKPLMAESQLSVPIKNEEGVTSDGLGAKQIGSFHTLDTEE